MCVVEDTVDTRNPCYHCKIMDADCPSFGDPLSDDCYCNHCWVVVFVPETQVIKYMCLECFACLFNGKIEINWKIPVKMTEVQLPFSGGIVHIPEIDWDKIFGVGK